MAVKGWVSQPGLTGSRLHGWSLLQIVSPLCSWIKRQELLFSHQYNRTCVSQGPNRKSTTHSNLVTVVNTVIPISRAALGRSRLEDDEFKSNLGFVGDMVLKGGGGRISTETVIKTTGVTEEERRYCRACDGLC